jgi:hypothetical protein
MQGCERWAAKIRAPLNEGNTPLAQITHVWPHGIKEYLGENAGEAKQWAGVSMVPALSSKSNF